MPFSAMLCKQLQEEHIWHSDATCIKIWPSCYVRYVISIKRCVTVTMPYNCRTSHICDSGSFGNQQHAPFEKRFNGESETYLVRWAEFSDARIREYTWWVVNSSPPSAAYVRQWTGSALVQIMACCLFVAKPLSEPMLGYCQMDP